MSALLISIVSVVVLVATGSYAVIDAVRTASFVARTLANRS